MTSTTSPSSFQSVATPGLPARAQAALRLLERLHHGSLTLRLPDGTQRHFGHGEPHASLVLHDFGLFAAAFAHGDVGVGEAYMEGRWSSPDLTALLTLLLANRQALDDALYGNWLGRLVGRLRHLLHRNTKPGSRRNIAAHYDLGNDFYALWLDETMNYSSGWFAREGMTLPQAQQAKVRRALDAAGVGAGSRVLEIGCGWGALAEAACERGAHVTGVTLSREQLSYAQLRLQLGGHAGNFDLRLQDYRDLAGESFDAICSIEMLEAVGREYWPRYFETVARMLRPGGLACIQSITISDSLWDRYVQGTDFIQQYVFPGGCLPCPREFVRHAQAAGLEVEDALAFGPDYARTLRLWRERFLAARAEVAALGFDERFMRMWEFYLCYCEAAFTAGNTDVWQFTLRKR